MDSQHRFQLPVMCILTDGERFQVFKFEAGEGQLPRFSLGKAVLELRAVCEYLYSVFLSAYQHGLTAWWNFEVQRSNQQGNMASTSDWKRPLILQVRLLIKPRPRLPCMKEVHLKSLRLWHGQPWIT